MTRPAASPEPDYVPIPESALGPTLNEDGYHWSRVEGNLFYVTDGTYQSAFLATPDGVVLFDAPPTIGNNLRRAVDAATAEQGTTNVVTHIVYSHHHADHAGAASLFGDDVIRIGHDETRRLLLRDNDQARPAPEVTFADTYSLQVGGSRAELAYHGPNHSPDNIFIHFPDHDALMLIDVVNSGWVPIFNCNLSEDIPGYIDAPATALTYPWQHYIGGHLGRLGARSDIELHQQYINDIVESSKNVLATVDPTPYYVNAWPNMWAGVKDHLSAVTDQATAPVVAKYTGVLAAADVEELTYSTTFMILQSLRLDYGAGSYVHP
jgi:glyoxylase-like metal-dependent hydrolase (beta-lactamase superfamily II)